MNNKGFTDNQTNIETPNDVGMTEKPLNSKINGKIKERVDINVLKSSLKKLRAKSSKRIYIYYLL